MPITEKKITDQNGLKWNVQEYGRGFSISPAEPVPPLDVLEIPEQLEGKPVLKIQNKAFFRHTFLREIRIPDSVTELGEKAFGSCTNLETVILSENITKIPEWCFAYCESLKHIAGLAHIIHFSAYCFYRGYAGSELYLPQEICLLGSYAFSECRQLEKLTLGKIGASGIMSFSRNPRLKEVRIDKENTIIPEYMFYKCDGLEKIDLPNSITEIKRYAFAFCSSLQNFKLPASLATLGENILYGNDMSQVILPEKFENSDLGFLSAHLLVRPTISVHIKYRDIHWKDSTLKIYYGEKIKELPLHTTNCRYMVGWYQNMGWEKYPQEFWNFLEQELGEWFKTASQDARGSFDFSKPIFHDITLNAKWEVFDETWKKFSD
ncbi:MAG: leucine-rich repeat domain-containing protein [Lachnospiraceae bacterium]|jgi:hypothetical protein|nr:leucine-rich repeat domain-containing protein [Lachnospiraceae bacterium]